MAEKYHVITIIFFIPGRKMNASMRIDCVFAPEQPFSWKFAFCARAEIEHLIATMFLFGGRSEISARAETHHVITLLEPDYLVSFSPG